MYYEDDLIDELIDYDCYEEDLIDESDEFNEEDKEVDDEYYESLLDEYNSDYEEPESTNSHYDCYGSFDYRDEFPEGIEGDAAYQNWLDDIDD